MTFQFLPIFISDFRKLRKENIKLTYKVCELVFDVITDYKAGLGRPEPLKHGLSGYWSREINEKHRLLYFVDETTNFVELHACYGHYDDK